MSLVAAYWVRIAAPLPDAFAQLQTTFSCSASQIRILDATPQGWARPLSEAAGYPWQALAVSEFFKVLPPPGSLLLELDEGPAQQTLEPGWIQTPDQLISYRERRSSGQQMAIQKQPLSAADQQSLLGAALNPAVFFQALLHGLTPDSGTPVAQAQLCSQLPHLQQVLSWTYLVNDHLEHWRLEQAWSSLRQALAQAGEHALFGYLLANLMAAIGRPLFLPALLERLQNQQDPEIRFKWLEKPQFAELMAEAASWAFPELASSRQALPEGIDLPPEAASAWAKNLYRSHQRLSDQLLPLRDARASWKNQGSLASHLIFKLAEQGPLLSWPERQQLHQLTVTALQKQAWEQAHNFGCWAFHNKMSLHWKISQLWQSLWLWLQTQAPGEVVELGCHQGFSSALFQTLLQTLGPAKTLHVYDSFAGLPPLTPQDQQVPYKAGSMQVELSHFELVFDKFQLPLPQVHAGWFRETLAQQLPIQVGWAYLDGDLYDSILISLQEVVPRMQPGGLLMIDDYDSPLFPGVKTACQDYFGPQPPFEFSTQDPLHCLAILKF